MYLIWFNRHWLVSEKTRMWNEWLSVSQLTLVVVHSANFSSVVVCVYTHQRITLQAILLIL